MQYEDVESKLPLAAEDLQSLDPQTRQFVEADLRAQAEIARYKKIMRSLEELRTQYAEPTEGLLDDILIALDKQGARSSRRKIALISAIGGATAAAAGVVVTVLALRSKKRLAIHG